MKTALPLLSKPLLRLRTAATILVLLSTAIIASAQCTPAAITWEWQYKYTSFTNPTRFAMGVTNMSMGWTGAVTSPVGNASTFIGPTNKNFTGFGATGYGRRDNVEFTVGAGTITLTFENEVSNVKFAIYDIDKSQTATVSAVNAAATALPVTMVGSNTTTNEVITGSTTTSAKATGPATDELPTATTSGVNIDIAGPVKTITITFTGAADVIWISNIAACVTGNFKNGYDSTLAPEPGTGQFVITANSSNSVYAVNVATGAATKIFTDAALSSINSLAYDAYKQQVYYVENTQSATNKTIYRYDIKTCTRIAWITDASAAPFNLVLNAGGLGAAAASYSNGCLFIGVDVSLSGIEDVAIWRINIDSPTGNPINASRTWGQFSYTNNAAIGQLYDWGDFIISNGVLYNFNRAANASPHENILHYDLNLQDTLKGFTNTLTTQTALDYNGTVYNLSYDVSPYDFNGNFGVAHTIAGDGWAGPSTDAAEYFKFPADYGDAPTTYGRPNHRIRACAGAGNCWIGSTVDYEINPVPAIPGQPATGDDNANYPNSGTTDDEDGFSSFPVLSVGASSYTLANIPVHNTTGAAVSLNGWIDFNGDGQFQATEFATVSVPNAATTATLTWNLAAFTPNTDIKVGLTYARFRIQTETMVDNATTTTVDERSIGFTLGGEVEDYQIEIKQLSISGNVYHDVNGMYDNTVNGIGFNNPSATPLYAYLVQAGNIVATVPVAANGAYSFDGIVNQNDTYSVVISTTNATIGNPAPGSSNLPSGWIETGEAYGTNNAAGTGNEIGTPNMVLAVNTTNKVVQNVNFGIEQRPLSQTNLLASQQNPGGKQAINFPPANFLGADPDASANLQRHILSFPYFADSININGVGYTPATWPSAGVTTTMTAAILVDPSNGADTINIPFSYVDSAGKESLVAGAVRKPLTDLLLTGTVYDDNNGGTINGIGSGTIGANTLYANLVSVATGKVLGFVPVNANGTYTISTAQGLQMVPTAVATFKVVVTNSPGVPGSTPPSIALITADNTAEGLGASPTTPDAAADGTYTVLTAITANIVNVNFGIDQLPSSTQPAPLAPQVNPGGSNFVSIPLSNFVGTDPEDNAATRYLHFIHFPDSVTTIRFTVNGTVTSYTAATFPAAGVYMPRVVGAIATLVDIDPINGGITAKIPFKVLDSATSSITIATATAPTAAFESLDSAYLLVPFTDFTLAGTVFNDYNGMTNNSVDGIGTNLMTGNTLYANLVLGTIVVGHQPVNPDGTYLLTTADGLKVNTASGAAGFSVAVSNSILANNSTIPASLTFPGSVSTGEALSPTGSDAQPADSKIQVATGTTNITGVNFGLDVLPIANNTALPSQINPGGTTQVTIPNSYFSSTDGNEPGNSDTVHITAFPTNITSIFINGVGYKSAAATGFLAFPAAGITVPLATMVLTIDPDPLNVGTITAVIPYKVKDTAGKESTLAGSVTVPFRDLGISGRVYDDPTGTTDGLVNGTPAAVIAGNTLWAYLVNPVTNAILGKQAVVTTAGNIGYYDFGTADGITPNTTFKVIISNVANATGTMTVGTLNTAAVYTADGNTTIGDGTPNGIYSILVGTSPIDSVNFGIDILPTVTAKTLPARINPGGTDTSGVLFTDFTAGDVDGVVSQIKITSLPATLTSINVNNTVYTSIPSGGLIINSTDVISVDPINGAVTAIIPFYSIDNADSSSLVSANLTIPFTELSLSGIIYNDPQAGTVGGTAALQADSIGTGVNKNLLYANLVDSVTGNVVSVQRLTTTGGQVATGEGYYNFTTANGLRIKHTFKVVVTNAAGTVGTPPPSTSLLNAANTAEGIGALSAGDGTPDGVLVVPIVITSITNANFGINELPTPTNATLTSQVNPGGKIAVTVPNANITGTDPVPGAPLTPTVPAKIHYTTFPTNTDSVTIGGVGYTAATWPINGVITPNLTTAYLLDPVAGAVSAIIPFKVIDLGGMESPGSATVTVPFTELTIAGTVFDDNNGLTLLGAVAGSVGGIPTNTIGSNVMNVNLVNIASGKVVGSVPVNANGTWAMTTVNGVQQAVANTFKLVVTNSAGIVGSTPPSTSLVNALNTGEGTLPAGDGTVDGSQNVPLLSTTNLTGLNFAIDQLPATIQPATLAPQINPGFTNFVNVPLSNFAGTDPEDGSATRYIHVTHFPDSVTTIRFTVNGTATSYTTATFPVAGVYIPRTVAAVASLIDIDPINGPITAKIPFTVLDSATTAFSTIQTASPAAKFESPDTSIVRVPFTDITLSGNVFNDTTGLKDNKVNGTGINALAGNTFYVNLLLNNLVVGYDTVNADGTYTLSTLQGLKVNVPISGTTGFIVAVTKSVPTIGAALAVGSQTLVGATFTGEALAPTGSDGTVDGKIAVAVVTSNITGVNFGVNVIPTGHDSTLPSRVNDPLIPFYIVANPSFHGKDVDGTVDSLVFTTFPTLTSQVRINGITYAPTASTGVLAWPAAGVKIKADTPFVVEVNPAATGNTTPQFTYKVIDNIGQVSTNPNVVNVPFRDLDLNGRVYNDHNGITDSLINGTPNGATVGQVYAYLINNATGKVSSKKTITIANGYYDFGSADGILSNTSYNVVVSSTSYAVTAGTTLGSTILPTLPATEVNTAEGNTTVGDGLPNGITTVQVGNDPVDSVNFGIDILPIATAHTNAAVLNPGDTNTIVIPFNSFTGTDADNSNVLAGVLITSLPVPATSNINRLVINGVSYTNATFPVGGISIYNTDVIAIDPVNNPTATTYATPSTTINAVLPFKVIDSAGKPSTLTANFTQPLTDLYLKGVVYDDPGGGTVNGTASNVIGSNTLYMNLVDSTSGLVVASRALGSQTTVGAFVFGTNSGVKANTTFNLIVTRTLGIVGQLPPTTDLINAENTGESIAGINTLGDLDSNGIATIPLGTTSPATDIVFGIDILPIPAGKTLASQVNPGGGTFVTVSPIAAVNSFVATDADGTVAQYQIIAFPGYVDSISIGGVVYTPATWPATGVNFTAATIIKIDPQNGDFTVNPIEIPFAAIDNAGHRSENTATVLVPLTDLTISGIIFDDANGTTDALVNGVQNDTIGVNVMNVSLVNNTTGLVIATKPANNDGTYSFGNNDGVLPSTTYKVVITNTPATVGSAPPSTSLIKAVNTADAFLNAADATADGTYTVAVALVSRPNINFGIDLLPLPDTTTLTPVVNVGGINPQTISFSNFHGTDPDGTLTSVHFTQFPANTYTMTIGATTYGTGATAFPAAGVTILTSATTTVVKIDPLDGVTQVRIPYTMIDNATKESKDTGFVIQPFIDLTISGKVFNDTNGLVNGIVDGTAINSLQGNTFYANLINTTTNKVIRSQAIAVDGSYLFTTADSVRQNRNYNVALSNASFATGATVSTALTNNVVNTGEGILAAGDGTINGVTAANMGAATITLTNVNFGVDAKPVSNSASYVIPQPNPNALMPLIAGNNLGGLTGTDPEQGPLLSGNTLTINTITGLNGNKLYYNNVLVTANTVIPNYDSTLLSIKFTSATATTSSFTFTYQDAAGILSPSPATYTISWPSALPLSLLDFEASKLADGRVQLNWQTSEERNTHHFEIERSVDGVRFDHEVGSVKAAGTTNQLLKYQSYDLSPVKGDNFYRLKMVDLDGSYTYSQIRVVNFGTVTADIIVYPTDNKDGIVHVILPEGSEQTRMYLLNAAGQMLTLTSENITPLNRIIYLSSLPAGEYMLQVVGTDGSRKSFKLVYRP